MYMYIPMYTTPLVITRSQPLALQGGAEPERITRCVLKAFSAPLASKAEPRTGDNLRGVNVYILDYEKVAIDFAIGSIVGAATAP